MPNMLDIWGQGSPTVAPKKRRSSATRVAFVIGAILALVGVAAMAIVLM